MGIRKMFQQMISDTLALWRGTGANRPFTRRGGMTEEELLKEYKESRTVRDENDRPSDQRPDEQRSQK